MFVVNVLTQIIIFQETQMWKNTATFIIKAPYLGEKKQAQVTVVVVIHFWSISFHRESFYLLVCVCSHFQISEHSKFLYYLSNLIMSSENVLEARRYKIEEDDK